MSNLLLHNRISQILYQIPNAMPVVRQFCIGGGKGIDCALIYLDGMIDKSIIDRDILRPLMIDLKDDISINADLPAYLVNRCIAMSNTLLESELNKAYYFLKRGKTILLINEAREFIILDTSAGLTRDISEPANETSIRGARDGFIENIETNISLLKRKLKDRNLTVELLETGRRTQTDLAIVYIDDIVDKDILREVKKRLQMIDVDKMLDTGELEQYIEDNPNTIFPQTFGSERPDVIVAHILEGRIAIVLDGTPYTITVPTILPEFFQTTEDYYQRTVLSNLVRVIRTLALPIVVYLPCIYLTLLKFNPEIIPLKFVIPLLQSRKQIALTPFLEIISILFVVELLREGGLRLPSRIAQTLSVVGGFIIGNAALQARLVTPTTLLIIGVTTIAGFAIPYYVMALCARLLTVIMLILANFLGVVGISAGTFLILVHLFSLNNFGIPYLNIINTDDFKDFTIRDFLWKMNKRPTSIPNNDPIRQTDFRKKFWRDSNEKNGEQ